MRAARTPDDVRVDLLFHVEKAEGWAEAGHIVGLIDELIDAKIEEYKQDLAEQEWQEYMGEDL